MRTRNRVHKEGLFLIVPALLARNLLTNSGSILLVSNAEFSGKPGITKYLEVSGGDGPDGGGVDGGPEGGGPEGGGVDGGPEGGGPDGGGREGGGVEGGPEGGGPEDGGTSGGPDDTGGSFIRTSS